MDFNQICNILYESKSLGIKSVKSLTMRAGGKTDISDKSSLAIRMPTVGFKNEVDSTQVHFQAIWSKLTVVIKSGREILSNFSGHARSGEIIAIMGPSGAGKTTFLNCLAGKVRPTSGQIAYYTKDKKASFAYVPQQDLLCPYLTVRESLILSSKLKNSQRFNVSKEHLNLVNEFLERFSLGKCADNLTRKCSGGESKRLSMALELISNPSFLLLDEPTSGLDSSTAFKCIKSLKSGVDKTEEAKKPLIIIIIHQPSSDLYNLFDKVFVLSQGSCIYEGNPSETVNQLSNFGVMCPTYCNPADFILNIASDTENSSLAAALKNSYTMKKDAISPADVTSHGEIDGSWKKVKPNHFRPTVSSLLSYFLLVKKFAIANFRDPQQSIFRLIEHLIFPITLVSIVAMKSAPSEDIGCTFLAHNETHMLPETFFQRVERQKGSISNLTLLYFNIFGIFMAGIVPGILSFSSQLGVYMKERQNNWYSTGPFFCAFITVSTAITFFHAMANSVAFLLLTGQQFTWTRFLLMSATNVLTAYLAESYSLIITSVNMYHELVSLIIGGSFAFVLQLFAGFVIKFPDTSLFGVLLSYLFPFRYLFAITIKTFYFSQKCFIGDDKIFTFNQVVEISDFLRHVTNSSLQEIRHIPDKIRIPLEENIWTKTKILGLAETANELDEEGVESLNNIWTQISNYMYTEYGIKNDGVWGEFGILLGLLFTHYFIAYCILLFKSRRRY